MFTSEQKLPQPAADEWTNLQAYDADLLVIAAVLKVAKLSRSDLTTCWTNMFHQHGFLSESSQKEGQRPWLLLFHEQAAIPRKWLGRAAKILLSQTCGNYRFVTCNDSMSLACFQKLRWRNSTPSHSNGHIRYDVNCRWWQAFWTCCHKRTPQPSKAVLPALEQHPSHEVTWTPGPILPS